MPAGPICNNYITMTRQIARTAAMTSLWRGLEHKKTRGIIYDPYALQIAKNIPK